MVSSYENSFNFLNPLLLKVIDTLFISLHIAGVSSKKEQKNKHLSYLVI